jgi:hypothetical protein
MVTVFGTDDPVPANSIPPPADTTKIAIPDSGFAPNPARDSLKLPDSLKMRRDSN